jgi:hypothetical protein
MSDAETARTEKPPSRRQPDWDDLLEDFFGLNIRAALTIRDLLVRPAEVFTAARTADWKGRYTPTFRVFFSLLALLFLFKFFWTGEDAMIRAPIEAVGDQWKARDPRLETDVFVESLMDLNWIIYPFAIGFWALLASLALNIWGSGTQMITRMRLYFAAVIPGTVFTMIWTIAFAKMPGTFMWLAAGLTMVITLLADGITTWRGLKPVHSGFGRFWRSILLACVTTFVALTGSLTSTMGAGWWVSQKVEHELQRLEELDTMTVKSAPEETMGPD